ncbi:MAG: PspC domain-containing protein [Xanthomonadales bacterium]|nr:PspC domain-containing protein [Xanthomonadales bacterium]
MSKHDAFDDFRQGLNGRPGQPIVLGVCLALAKRFNLEPWVTRVIAILAGLLFSLPALIGYIVLGYVLDETRERTSGFFKGLWLWINERIPALKQYGEKSES